MNAGVASRPSATRAVEGIAIVAGGMFAGTMLTIGLTLGGYWQSLEPQAFLDWFAANERFVRRTIPVVALPTLAATVSAFALRRRDPARVWWAGALAAWLGVAVLTFAWFVPANVDFASGSFPVEDVPDRLATWLRIHWARIGLGIVGASLGLVAFGR
jgi:hypothetical protein